MKPTLEEMTATWLGLRRRAMGQLIWCRVMLCVSVSGMVVCAAAGGWLLAALAVYSVIAGVFYDLCGKWQNAVNVSDGVLRMLRAAGAAQREV